MELDYPISFSVHGQLCLENAPNKGCTLYPTEHIPMRGSDTRRKIDPKKVAEVLRDLGRKYPSGLWCVKFPIAYVEIAGHPDTPLQAVSKSAANNIAQHAAGLLESDFLNKDDVSTGEDGVTVFESCPRNHNRYGVVQVTIEFSIGSATSKCVDKVAEILAPWLD